MSSAVLDLHNQESGSSIRSSAEVLIEASSNSLPPSSSVSMWKDNESSDVPIEEEVRDRTSHGAPARNRPDDDDEDEEDVCRICRNPGEVDNPLRYPCACSGSIKFVHQDCLLQWLKHSNARQCEVYGLPIYLG